MYEKRSMLPYQIGCVYWFVNNILYRLSEYRLKVISVQHKLKPIDDQHNPWLFWSLIQATHQPPLTKYNFLGTSNTTCCNLPLHHQLERIASRKLNLYKSLPMPHANKILVWTFAATPWQTNCPANTHRARAGFPHWIPNQDSRQQHSSTPQQETTQTLYQLIYRMNSQVGHVGSQEL